MTPHLNNPIISSSRYRSAQENNYQTPTIRSTINVNANPHDNRVSRDPSMRYLSIGGLNAPRGEDSFEKMKYLPSPSQNIFPNRSFNESFVAVAQDLSFDIKTDHQLPSNPNQT